MFSGFCIGFSFVIFSLTVDLSILPSGMDSGVRNFSNKSLSVLEYLKTDWSSFNLLNQV